jgi:Ribbon-helix-helix protein, copG family
MAKVKEETYRMASGDVLTEADIEKIADEVESDEPVAFRKMIPIGRPSLNGGGASPRLSFRIPSELYDAAMERAIKEETTVSEVTRQALEKYLAG